MIKYTKVNLVNFFTRILYTFIVGDLIGISLLNTFIIVLGVNTIQGYFLHKNYSFSSNKEPILRYIIVTFSIAMFEWYIHKALFPKIDFQFIAIGITSVFIFIFRYFILKRVF